MSRFLDLISSNSEPVVETAPEPVVETAPVVRSVKNRKYGKK